MPKKRKPPVAEIEQARPLSENPRRREDPIMQCNLCGRPGDLRVWREHDARDIPLEGPERLVFIAEHHPACLREMDRHPRLYAKVTGGPGTFPKLCGPCTQRRGFACADPRQRALGGPGLNVQLSGGLPPGVIACPPPRIVHQAEICEGRKILGDGSGDGDAG